MDLPVFELRPSVSNRNQWFPERPKRSEWEKLRRVILERDNHTCLGCKHRAIKYMEVHHADEAESNDPADMRTLCPACHAVTHMGLSLQHESIEIWQSALTQVQIVQLTRQGVQAGKSLAEINGGFDLKKGRLAPGSIDWANNLLKRMGPEPRAELPKPLCAVFVKFQKWQIEE